MTVSWLMSRRRMLATCGGLAAAQCGMPILAATPASGGIGPELLRRATQALHRHGGQIRTSDVMAVVDFSSPSWQPRLHLIDTMGGTITTLLVAHGRGSDPAHSGWVQRFSNAPGSQASSAGAYMVGDIYIGKHGRSRRLDGLDPQNDNAEPRAIVIHAAQYVGPEMIKEQGKLGRSEGCFAVSESDLGRVLDILPAGALLYADKL